MIVLWTFLNDAFHVRVRQRSSWLLLHTVLDVYPYIDFMNKELSIVQKLDVIFS